MLISVINSLLQNLEQVIPRGDKFCDVDVLSSIYTLESNDERDYTLYMVCFMRKRGIFDAYGCTIFQLLKD